MSVVIAVHGTFAGGEGTGDAWWQSGGQLQDELRLYLAADDGAVKFEPFSWHDTNSGLNRSEGGSSLLRRLYQLEARSEKYCLIGHSHGGSVISHALLSDAAAKKSKLPNLSKWITVGTPFIHNRRHSLLFFRLGTLGQSAYSIMLLYALIFLCNVAATVTNTLSLGATIVLANYAIYAFLMVSSAIVLFALLAYFQPKKLRYYRKGIRDNSRSAFQQRWLPICHEDDEAVQSLKKAAHLNFSPIARDFAVERLAVVSIVILPLIVAAFSLSPGGPEFVKALTQALTGEIYFIPEGWIQRTADAAMRLTSLPAQVFLYYVNPPFGSLYWKHAATGASMIAAVTSMYILSYWIFKAVRALAHSISGMLSAILNRATVAGIRNTLWGGDTTGEDAVGSAEFPDWITVQGIPLLPSILADEMTLESNKAAAVAIARIRKTLKELTFFDDKARTVDQIATALNLSSRELIGTTYFHVPRVRKLIIYAIAQSEGFRATEALTADPDFETIRSAYDQLINAMDSARVSPSVIT